MTPIYVVTTHDPSTNSTDTAGAFTNLGEAKKEALSLVSVLNHLTMFIEEWRGGTFHSHRELRGDQWFVAQGPAFAPIEEKTA